MSKRESSDETAAPIRKRRLPRDALPDLTTPPVTIVVGNDSDAKTFYLREDAIRTHSDFLNAALQKAWSEGQSRAINLPEQQPRDFEQFAAFVLDGHVRSGTEASANETVRDFELRLRAEMIMLCDYWLIGEYLQSTNFKDAVLDALVDVLRDYAERATVAPKLHEKVYPSTAGPNPLRRCVVDVAVCRWGRSALVGAKMHNEWQDFFKDYALGLHDVSSKQRDGRPPWDEPPCFYHEHTALGKPCYKTLFKL